MKRTVHFYLLKIARLSGWLLLPLMILYLVTGYVLCPKFGFERLMDAQTALQIHRLFDWPLVAALLVHAVLAVYFALRRWGWIGSRKCP